MDAEVSSLNAELKLRPGMTMEELRRQVVEYEKRKFYEKTGFGRITKDEGLEFSSPGRYDEIYEHILVHKYFANQGRKEEISFAEALDSWYKNVYHPIVVTIEELGLLSRFAGRTASDLYVYIVKYWDELKRKYGLSYPIADAAKGFGELYGETRTQRIRAKLRKALTSIIHRG